MWPFRKKNTYYIIWSYGEHHADVGIRYTEFIKGYDIGDAWRRLQKKHTFPLFMIEIKRMD